jgi:hypothetical protein
MYSIRAVAAWPAGEEAPQSDYTKSDRLVVEEDSIICDQRVSGLTSLNDEDLTDNE